MEKKNNASLIAVIVLGILCVGMIVANIVLYSGASVGKIDPKSKSDKKDKFEETEETAGYGDIEVSGSDFEMAFDVTLEDAEEGETVDYICPESEERELTEADVEALKAMTIEGLPEGKGIIQMVINEMYARRGYQFTDQAIQAYFDSKEWYQEITDRTDDMNAVLAGMSDVEKTNVDFLSTYVE